MYDVLDMCDVFMNLIEKHPGFAAKTEVTYWHAGIPALRVTVCDIVIV